jgi:hypothetical protein
VLWWKNEREISLRWSSWARTTRRASLTKRNQQDMWFMTVLKSLLRHFTGEQVVMSGKQKGWILLKLHRLAVYFHRRETMVANQFCGMEGFDVGRRAKNACCQWWLR